MLLVAATDILGYFAGRILGGPKFWPRGESRKKNVVGARVRGLDQAALGSDGVFHGKDRQPGWSLIAISVALSMAKPDGRHRGIGESRRHVGVKDSSNLLPGHGGVYDRFDGLLGAAFLLVIVESLTAFPPPPL